MTFTTNVPQSGETLGQTRDRIRTNFQKINTLVGVNHFSFNVANEGKHKFLQVVARAAIPPGLLATEGTIYTKTAAGAVQVFYTNGASGNEYQLTSVNDAAFASFGGTNTKGWTFLAGNLVLQWDAITTSAVLSAKTFARPFTAVRSFTWGISTGSIHTSAPLINLVTTTGFSISDADQPRTFYYIAIGEV